MMFEGSNSPSSMKNFFILLTALQRILSDLERFSDTHNLLVCTVAFLLCDRINFIACTGVSKVARASGGVMSIISTSFYPSTPRIISSTNDSTSSMALSTNPPTTATALSTPPSLPASGVGLLCFDKFCSR